MIDAIQGIYFIGLAVYLFATFVVSFDNHVKALGMLLKAPLWFIFYVKFVWRDLVD